MWLRAFAPTVVLCVWVVVRLGTGRSVRHPWLVAILLCGVASLVSDASTFMPTAPAHGAYALAALLFFGCLFALGEGLRSESGIAPTSPRRRVVLAGIFAAVALACGFLPPPRDRILADIVGAAFLLTLLEPLIASPRRIASWLLGLGIVGYALSRSVLVVARLHGGDVLALEHVFDSGVIAVLGAGIVTFVLEGAFARKTAPTR
jgi:hypothetical protein